MRITLDTNLSDRETYLIGSIVSQWGFLEADIFEQTLVAMSGNVEPFPPAMNNTNFGLVLPLWVKWVVEPRDDERRSVLMAQYASIIALNEFRQALVHSRWEWTPDKRDKIVAVRAKKKELIRTIFTVDDLIDMASRIGEIRYLIRFPSSQDRADEVADDRTRVSRKGWEMILGPSSSADPNGGTL
ncbi:hypothetical protein DSM25558_4371 [Agrobacterium sp. DSM 25558]|uniref:hypothetical protein n=1 Tax=Agrobacterium sp. DSM 25558 TaxID=1907665 RepID=UPI0009724D1E|nr:hypothetical protein [Agrobacterium sp. DSM 25558]SCX28095.1 hypothetical protein DSM25558_4371 [Agrobacterium sp. DSM 25558]